jgi:CRISPR-associated protein (TIGR02710 family)
MEQRSRGIPEVQMLVDEVLPRPRAMLVSLGGSPAPVLHTLNEQRPQYVLFFVSPTSAGEVQTVIKGLQYRCVDCDRIMSASAEVLAECYRAIRDELPAHLERWGVGFEELAVDYTGGTKSMSAALVLATADRVHGYSYVGGVERDKGGLGVVIDGRERMWYLQNPWKELVRDELVRVRVYFGAARYRTAYEELEGLAARATADSQPLLQALGNLALGYGNWDDFRHREAARHLGQAYEFLRVFALGSSRAAWGQLASAVKGNLEFLGPFSDKKRGEGARRAALIPDLLANADRRARVERKHEDGVARLYSCLERGARFRLLARPEPIDTEEVSPKDVPAALLDEFERRYLERGQGRLKLPLLASYQLLDALGDEMGVRFMARETEIRRLLDLRNRAYLGHGERPVGEAEYSRFREMLVGLLDLREQDLPVFPALPELALP